MLREFSSASPQPELLLAEAALLCRKEGFASAAIAWSMVGAMRVAAPSRHIAEGGDNFREVA
jgi:hypothetical protein